MEMIVGFGASSHGVRSTEPLAADVRLKTPSTLMMLSGAIEDPEVKRAKTTRPGYMVRKGLSVVFVEEP